ncbi:MAG: DNA-binding beta-propeller fold protein YncE [Candidatus Latescibacterota bacterium]|jgi:DNA-binding beta-propeller fold protein YncE
MRSIATIAVLLGLILGSAQAQSDLFIITSDFSTGSTSLLKGGVEKAELNLLGVHSDAVGHYHDGRIYIVNRFGQDNILVLDESDLRTPLTQFSVGNGTNPHDIEIVAADKAYVTLYERSELLIVDPRDGAERGRIDLSAFSDADGLPEVSQIVRAGQRLYLSCQRLDRNNGWGPVDQSFLIVVDIASDSLIDADPNEDGVQGILLSASNPNALAVIGDRIAVSTVASFGDRNGGIDLIDTATNRSLGIAVGEEALGGDINSMVMVDSERGFAVISDENFANHVLPFNLRSGEVGAALEGLSGGFIPSIAVDGNRLIVADQGSFSDPTSAGLKIFDASNGQLLEGPIATGLPPVSIVVLGDSDLPTVPTAVREEAALPQDSALGRAYPNPFNASVAIPFSMDGHTSVQLVIYDALGRTVRSLDTGFFQAGNNTAIWDGRDNAGRVVGNGAYIVRLQTGTALETAKILLLK